MKTKRKTKEIFHFENGKKCEAKMRERFFLYFILSSLLFLRTFYIEWRGKNVAYIKNVREGEMGEERRKWRQNSKAVVRVTI